MFNNLDWTNIAVLLLLALFVFGDKLPQAISDGFRLLRNLRRMARSATSDLSRELGTDIQLEDLHPKAFIRKHVLSEADQETLVKPLKGLSQELASEARGLQEDLRDVGKGIEEPPAGRPARGSRATSQEERSGGNPPAPRPGYDDLI